eukprot:14032137-Heterocapsa_arctica.AAC.1
MPRAFGVASACGTPMLPRRPCPGAAHRFLGAYGERPLANIHPLPSPSGPAWLAANWPGGWICDD